MSYDHIKKIISLSDKLDSLGLHSYANQIDGFLRKIAEPQGNNTPVQEVEFDAQSIFGEVLKPYRGAGYVAQPSLVGDRPVYIVNGGDLDKVLKEKGLLNTVGFDDTFAKAIALTKKQLSEVTDPVIAQSMKRSIGFASIENPTSQKGLSLIYGGASTVLVPVGEGLRLVPGISMGKDSQGRDIPLLVNSSGGYETSGYGDNKKTRKVNFISSSEEKENSYRPGVYDSDYKTEDIPGYYEKPSLHVKFRDEDLHRGGKQLKPKSKNLVSIFGWQGSDSFGYSFEVRRSAIKDPFAGVSNPGKEALEMRTQANLKAYPNNLGFGSTPPGSPITTYINLYNISFVDVEIQSVELDSSDVFTISQPEKTLLKQGEKTKVIVTFTPSLPYGDKVATITIRSNSKDGDIVVPITAAVERPKLPPREKGMATFKMGLRKSTNLKIPVISNDDYLILDRSNPRLARMVDGFDTLSEEQQEDLLESIARNFEKDAPDVETLDEKFRKARGVI